MSDLLDAASPTYRALARKYRPTRFDDLIGQEPPLRSLRRGLAQARLPYAWMLTGVRGVGKTTVARIIARGLNCDHGPTAEPCGTCPNCRDILADRHPDVIEMDAASNTGVDDVRQMTAAADYRPMQARFKVFIIDEAHMLSRHAWNALLKTLEEPPDHARFIFATIEARKVPATVLSRCQRFDLRRISVAELAGLFGRVADAEGAVVTSDAVRLIADVADGSARDGLSLLDQAIADADGGAVQVANVAAMLGVPNPARLGELLRAVLAGNAPGTLDLIHRIHQDGGDFGTILPGLLSLVHVLARLKGSPDAASTIAAPLANWDEETSLLTLCRLWQVLLRGAMQTEQTFDRREAVEMTLIQACHAAVPP